MGEATAELKALTVLNPTPYMPVSGTGCIYHKSHSLVLGLVKLVAHIKMCQSFWNNFRKTYFTKLRYSDYREGKTDRSW